MWGDKQPQPATPAAPQGQRTEIPRAVMTANETSPSLSPSTRPTAWLGPNLTVKGEITGDEDLRVDGRVEGPISIGGHRLTVGSTAVITAEVIAREIVVYGRIHGDLRAADRIEIKKNGSVTGDLTTARIMIEDGAFFKGQIEIDRNSAQIGTDLSGLLSRADARGSKKNPALENS